MNRTPTCIDCGGPNSAHRNPRCRACYVRAAPGPQKTCADCGCDLVPRYSRATRCRACYLRSTQTPAYRQAQARFAVRGRLQ